VAQRFQRCDKLFLCLRALAPEVETSYASPTSIGHKLACNPRRHRTHRNKTALAMSSGTADAACGRLAASRMKAWASSKLRALAAQAWEFQRRRANTVHADIILAVVDSHGKRQVDSSAFGGAVGRSPRPIP